MSKLSSHELLLRAASGQNGVVGRAELIVNGFSPSLVDHARKAKRLIPVFTGAYAVGREVETVAAVWQAAIIAAGPGVALTGRSAAEAWGIIRPVSGLPRRVEVGRPPGRRSRVMTGGSPQVRRTRLHILQRKFRHGEVVLRQGIPVTDPVSTVIELARTFDQSALSFAFIEACRLGLIQQKDLAVCLERSLGQPGARKVRYLIGLWVPELERTRSALEGLFLINWVERDARLPEVNVKVMNREVDFLWRSEMVVVEVDGKAFHRDEVTLRRDRDKQARLESAGYTVLRFGYRDVTECEGEVAATTKRHLDAAAEQ